MDSTLPPISEDTAKGVVDAVLNATGLALRCGDFHQFHPHFRLPYRVETFEGAQDLHSLDDLQRLFENARAYYARKRVAQLLRTCLSVVVRDSETLVATYETLLMPHIGSPTRAPYLSNMEMAHVDGQWLVYRQAFAIADDAMHSRVMLGHPSTPEH